MKIKNIIYISVLAASLNSCELDFAPSGSVSSETITANDFKALLSGAYDGVQSLSMGLPFVADDLAADNLNARTWQVLIDMDICSIPTDNSYIAGWWNRYYTNIERCNDLILQIDNQNSTSDELIKIKAQACVIRAWNYYRLTTLWGKVPVVTQRTIASTPRNSEVEVWSQIRDDLEYAATNAPNFSEPSYASVEAAKAMLARVYLIAPDGVKDLTKAKNLAEELISDTRFALADEYSDIWQSKSSKEIILQWANIIGDGGGPGWFLRSNLTVAGETVGLGRYEFPVDQALFNVYEPGDNRKAASVRHLQSGNNETWDCIKYPSYDANDPWPVVRIAEMYLISAEAQGYPAGISRLNDLRTKRNLPALVEGSTITASNFLYKIMAERRVELAFEGHRFYDLRRWFYTDAQGKQDVLSFRSYQNGEAAGSRPTASDMMNLSEDGYNLLFPIGAEVIAVNPGLLPNNPGY